MAPGWQTLPDAPTAGTDPATKPRRRYHFVCLPSEVIPSAFNEDEPLTGAEFRVRAHLGKLIGDGNRISYEGTFAQLAPRIGVSTRSMSRAVWRLRCLGHLVTERVSCGKHFFYRFYLPCTAPREVLEASLAELALEQLERAAPAPGKPRIARPGPSGPPPTPSQDDKLACQDGSPSFRPFPQKDHHGATPDASGYDRPSRPMEGVKGEGWPTEPLHKLPAGDISLPATIQAEILARVAQIASEDVVGQSRPEAIEAELLLPTDQEVPRPAARAEGILPEAELEQQEVPTPLKPRRQRKATPPEPLTFPQQEAARLLTSKGVHRHHAEKLAREHPETTIRKAIHELGRQRNVRNGPGWICNYVKVGGYTSAEQAGPSIEAQREAAKAKELADIAREKAAAANETTAFQRMAQAQVHPSRRAEWETAALERLQRNRFERGLEVGSAPYRAAVWNYKIDLAKEGHFRHALESG